MEEVGVVNVEGGEEGVVDCVVEPGCEEASSDDVAGRVRWDRYVLWIIMGENVVELSFYELGVGFGGAGLIHGVAAGGGLGREGGGGRLATLGPRWRGHGGGKGLTLTGSLG